MKVTPLDIRRKEFRRSVRGYLDEDVDVFLDSVADEVERLSRSNAELQEKIRSLEEQVAGHAEIREALEKTLVAAQLQSQEIRTKAEKESQSMLKEAEAKAKTVVEDFYARTGAVQQTLMQLKLLEEDFRFKFKGLLEGYLKMLEEQAPFVSTPAEAVGKKVNREGGVAVSVEEAAEAAPRPPRLPRTAGSVAEAGVPESEGHVYFGRRDDDPDDPFPEIGGDPATPRDFSW